MSLDATIAKVRAMDGEQLAALGASLGPAMAVFRAHLSDAQLQQATAALGRISVDAAPLKAAGVVAATALRRPAMAAAAAVALGGSPADDGVMTNGASLSEMPPTNGAALIPTASCVANSKAYRSAAAAVMGAGTNASAGADALLGHLFCAAHTNLIATPAASAAKRVGAQGETAAPFARPTVDLVTQVASAASMEPSNFVQHSWTLRCAIAGFIAGGTDVVLDACVALVQPRLTGVPSDDAPPKRRPLVPQAADEAALTASGAGAPLSYSAFIALLIDAVIASTVPTEASEPAIPFGAGAALIASLCHRSVRACRVMQRWALSVFTPSALPKAEDVSVAFAATLDGCVRLVALLLSQFGFEFPWQLLSTLGAADMGRRQPVARAALLDLLGSVAPLTFADRLEASLPGALVRVAPVDPRALARDRGTATFEDPENLFAVPHGYDAGVADYRRLLLTAGEVAAQQYNAPGHIQRGSAVDPVTPATVRSLLLRRRQVGAAALTAPRVGGSVYVTPGEATASAGGALLDTDVRLAAYCLFAGTPAVPSLLARSARVLARAIPGSESAASGGDALDHVWIDVAAELLAQLLSQESGDAVPNGPVATGVTRVLRGVRALAEEGVIRAAAVAAFFRSERTVQPLLSTLPVKQALSDLAELYCTRLVHARATLAATTTTVSDDAVGDASSSASAATLRVVFAESEAHAFFREVGDAIAYRIIALVASGGAHVYTAVRVAAAALPLARLAEASLVGLSQHVVASAALDASATNGDGFAADDGDEDDVPTALRQLRTLASQSASTGVVAECAAAVARAAAPEVFAVAVLRTGQPVSVLARPLVATLTPSAAEAKAVAGAQVALERAWVQLESIGIGKRQ
jgi:hypothetical protein